MDSLDGVGGAAWQELVEGLFLDDSKKDLHLGGILSSRSPDQFAQAGGEDNPFVP